MTFSYFKLWYIFLQPKINTCNDTIDILSVDHNYVETVEEGFIDIDLHLEMAFDET